MLVVSLNYNNNYLLFKICCETIVVVIFYFLMVHLLKFQKITFDLVQELVSILLYIHIDGLPPSRTVLNFLYGIMQVMNIKLKLLVIESRIEHLQ